MQSETTDFNCVARVCEACFTPLVLNSARDIKRKKYCSASCRNSVGTRKRIAALPHRSCQHCGAEYKARSTNQKFCSAKCANLASVGRGYAWMNDNPRGYITHLIAKPDRKHLTIESMLELLEKQKGLCAITGIELTFIKRRDGVKVHTNLSIDQIEAGKGYSLDNIQFVCAVVNVMKTTLSMQDFKWWCTKVVEGGK